MKTNNVDFGKSFKFKTNSPSLIYTCSAVDSKGECIVSWDWGKGDGVESTDYMGSSVRDFIKRGSWIVIPTDMKEIVGHSGPGIIYPFEKPLLDQIKDFTATSKHSVNIYEGAYEVFRAGENGVYKCNDDETLRSVMQALSVLDGVMDE